MTNIDRKAGKKYDATELVRPDVALTTKAIIYLNMQIEDRLANGDVTYTDIELGQLAKDYFTAHAQDADLPTLPGVINGATRFLRRRLADNIDFASAFADVQRTLGPILLVNPDLEQIYLQDQATFVKTVQKCLGMIENSAKSPTNPYGGDTAAWKK